MPADQWGGIQQMVEGLARGLSTLDVDDEFIFIGFPDAATRSIRPRQCALNSAAVTERIAADRFVTMYVTMARAAREVDAASTGPRPQSIPSLAFV